MTADTETYTIVWADGVKYVLHEEEYSRLDKLVFAFQISNIGEFRPFRTAEGNPPIYIRLSAISSYFISTPEVRKLWEEWSGEGEEQAWE
jgi:hypothetical protein